MAECSMGSILPYFRPSLSYHLSLICLFLCIFEWPFYTGFTLFLSGHFTQVLLCCTFQI